MLEPRWKWRPGDGCFPLPDQIGIWPKTGTGQGMVQTWTPLPVLPDDTYIVAQGFRYRVAAILSGTVAPVSHTTLISKLQGMGWSNVAVFDQPPGDWPGGPLDGGGDQVVYIDAVRSGAQAAIKWQDTYHVALITAFAYQAPQAWVLEDQPAGFKPQPIRCPAPPAGAAGSKMTLGQAALYLGGAAAVGSLLTLGAQWAWRKWKGRR